ncbi:MAG: HEAT repeat domain-containing protein [Planctomycetes bacterium]|nr:HEAT repeat domain-containing protein [Planctomycetota bacterium]
MAHVKRVVTVAGTTCLLLVVGRFYLWQPSAIAFWSWRAQTTDDTERHLALNQLAGIGPRAIQGISKSLRHPNLIVRFNAAETLGEIRHPDAIGFLAQALTDEAPMVQCMAARSLADIGDKGAIPFLLERLVDRNTYVRFEAALALERLGDLTGVPILIDKLDNPRLGSIAEARLRGIAQKSFGLDKAAWRRWWAAEGASHMPDRFQVSEPPATAKPGG